MLVVEHSRTKPRIINISKRNTRNKGNVRPTTSNWLFERKKWWNKEEYEKIPISCDLKEILKGLCERNYVARNIA